MDGEGERTTHEAKRTLRCEERSFHYITLAVGVKIGSVSPVACPIALCVAASSRFSFLVVYMGLCLSKPSPRPSSLATSLEFQVPAPPPIPPPVDLSNLPEIHEEEGSHSHSDVPYDSEDWDSSFSRPFGVEIEQSEDSDGSSFIYSERIESEEVPSALKEARAEVMRLRQELYYLQNAPIGDLACVVCQTLRPKLLFRPCKHVCCCSECARRVTICPMCRVRIRAKVEVYL